MLSIRQYQITKKLLETKEPIKIKDLSVECGVSVRTIQYDLEKVREFFQREEGVIISQSNKGLQIDCEDFIREEIMSHLSAVKGEKMLPEQDTRIQKMVFQLLCTNEYITAADLAVQLDVSRNTIFNDLTDVEKLLNEWQLQLERRARLGFKIVGKESQIRSFFEYYIVKALTNYNIYNFIKGMNSNDSEAESYIPLDDVLKEYMVNATECLKGMLQQYEDVVFQDSHLVGICVRLTVIGVRLQHGFTIGSYRTAVVNTYENDCEEVINLATKEFLNVYAFPCLEDEMKYVIGDYWKGVKELDLVTITKNIIDYVSVRENVQYAQDVSLYHNLLTHLSVKFNNNSFYVEAATPFTKEIKNKHHNLFLSIKEACSIYLDVDRHMMNDAFITFIALHFLVSLEWVNSCSDKVRALYVCSTGRGVARLIKNRVESEIKNIEVAAYCSITEVEEMCRKMKVQLIISVFPIQSYIPVAVVEGVPTQSNISYIKELVKNITNSDQYSDGMEEVEENPAFENQISSYDVHPEEISQEIILKGYEVANDILEQVSHQMMAEKKNAFILHVLLMIHRTYFQKQYDNFVYSTIDGQSKEMLEVLTDITKKHHIHINDAELIALTQYLK